MALYTFLNESFDESDGGLIGYALNNITQTAPANRHYNLRSFSSFNYTIARTMQDLSFWNVYNFSGQTMTSLQNPVSLIGGQAIFNPISAIDGRLMGSMDTTAMSSLDFFYITAGSEQWAAVSGTKFTLAKNPNFRYADLLNVTVSGIAAVTSTYNDDILTHFNIPGQEYFIDFIARSLVITPSGGQLALDLTKSAIDFSSDPSGNFDPSRTDSFTFNQSIIDMSQGGNGDKIFRIKRSSLTHADLTNLKHIQFRLITSGTGQATNFQVQALRMYPVNNYTFGVTDIDTKREFYTRSVPAITTTSGTAEPSSSSGIYFFGGTSPKNVVQTIRFNSGHSPTTTGNIINLYYRYTADANGLNPNYIKLAITASGSGTLFTVSSSISGTQSQIAQTSFSGLTNETDYFLRTSLLDSTFRAAIYNVDSAFAGSVVYDQGNLAVPLIGRGQLGWELNPYNYDFTLDYIRVGLAEFGELRTKAAPSFTPVRGVLLKNVVASQPIDLLDGQSYIAAQDATLSTSTTFGLPTPPSYFLQRGITDWWGGIFSKDFITIGNTAQLYIEGDIYPSVGYTGIFRIVFIDNYGSIGFLKDLTGLLGGQWNHFFIPIRIDIAPNAYQIGVVNDGFGGDSFYLDNFQLLHHTIGWAASSDNGVTWQPFYNNINSDIDGVNFKSPNRNLKIQARTHSDSAWIANFAYEPIYAYPGLYEPNSYSISLRITGQ